jgi:type II secretory pathway predicted ATPase ExeA
MYQEYFGLSEKPFAETPDSEFLYLSVGHREGLAHLEFNILDGKGFSVLIGEVGTGKTTLCRALIDRLDAQKITVLHIIHTNLDFHEFLREVVEELGISSQGQQKWDLLKALNHYLIEAYGQNRQVVLIVDEAQNLKPSVLEGIRMLSNLETPREKLIQIVFVGQPGLARNMERPDMVQLKQRVAGTFYLGPLTRVETHGYVVFRLSRVQPKSSLRFTPEAMDLIYRFSRGIPRLINFLCDSCLIHAYVAETWTIDPFLVRRAQKEIEGTRSAGELNEERTQRFHRNINETHGRGVQTSGVKEIQAKVGFFEKPGPGAGSVAEEKFSGRPEKSKRARIALLVFLAVTVAGLGSMAAFTEWRKQNQGFEAAGPANTIKIPLTEMEKDSRSDPLLPGKRLSKMSSEPEGFEVNPTGASR